MPKVIEGVYFVSGQDEMIPDSHVYVLGDPSSRDLTLVDAGLTGKGAYKSDSILKSGIVLEDIKRVIMTHTHFDHIGCLNEIQKRIPAAELWVHVLEADPLEKGDERTVYGMDMFKSMCQMQYRTKEGDFRFKVHRKIKDKESLDIGGMTWEVLHIPGHSMGSIALYCRERKTLIPGDTVYADYAIGRFDLHGANALDLKDSLVRLAGLEVETLLPGHNQIVKNLPKGYIQKTARQWEAYLT